VPGRTRALAYNQSSLNLLLDQNSFTMLQFSSTCDAVSAKKQFVKTVPEERHSTHAPKKMQCMPTDIGHHPVYKPGQPAARLAPFISMLHNDTLSVHARTFLVCQCSREHASCDKADKEVHTVKPWLIARESLQRCAGTGHEEQGVPGLCMLPCYQCWSLWILLGRNCVASRCGYG
jgi:hypothetical protein